MIYKEIKINKELHACLKSYCSSSGLKIGASVEAAIQEYLKSKGQSLPVKTFTSLRS